MTDHGHETKCFDEASLDGLNALAAELSADERLHPVEILSHALAFLAMPLAFVALWYVDVARADKPHVHKVLRVLTSGQPPPVRIE